MARDMPIWSEGRPSELAEHFHEVMGEHRKLVGLHCFLHYVAAIGSAAMHQVVVTTPKEKGRERIKNIVLTVRAIAAALPERDEEDEDDEFDEDEDIEPLVEGSPDHPLYYFYAVADMYQGRPFKPRRAPKQPSPSHPTPSESLVGQADVASGTLGSAPTSHESPVPSPGCELARDPSYNVEAEAVAEDKAVECWGPEKESMFPPQLSTPLATETEGLARDKSRDGSGQVAPSSDAPPPGSPFPGQPSVKASHSAGPPLSGLPCPTPILQEIFSHLDPRSVRVAAGVCKQFRAMFRQTRQLPFQKALECYILSMYKVTIPKGYDDGNLETRLALKWPVDGSPCAGQDLQADASRHTTLGMLPLFMDLMRHVPSMFTTQLSESEILQRALGDKPAADRRPPRPNSSPLAVFKQSEPVTWGKRRAYSSNYTKADDSKALPQGQGPLEDDYLTAASCDISIVGEMREAIHMHVNGDLLAVSHPTGWKQRDPGLTAINMTEQSWNLDHEYSHGLFEYARRVCSDRANALVWCAADGGKRVKAFRAPSGLEPLSADAACNRDIDNQMQLQYTFSTAVPGLTHKNITGLYVIGTKVFCINGHGAVFQWDIADLPPQERSRHSNRALDSDDVEDPDDEEVEGVFRGCLGMRNDEAVEEVEVSMGVNPHTVSMLPCPRRGSKLSLRSGDFCSIFDRTCLLNDGQKTLAVSLSSNVVVTYDITTMKAKQTLLGHMHEISDLAPAPLSWQQPDLFASCSRTGDVKLWDVRTPGPSAAVTLTNGRTSHVLLALALASGGSSTSEDRSQLGPGMVCFAGGTGQGIWAWDLRAGQARVLYELSTGNMVVHGLAWHEGSSSLIASCECMTENRLGESYKEDFYRIDNQGRRMPGPGDYEDEDYDDDDDDAFKEVDSDEVGVIQGALAAAGAEEDEGDLYDEDEEGGQPILDDDQPRWWPERAVHQGDDFPVYFNSISSCVLRYRFSQGAEKGVPVSRTPIWEGMW